MHSCLHRSRMDLAFTSATPAGEAFRPVCLPDVRGGGGAVMTDGCGFLSKAAMEAAWTAHGGNGRAPCALQGRLGGCKGVWVALSPHCVGSPAEARWAAVRPSQRKVHLPSPSPECVCTDLFATLLHTHTQTNKHASALS